MNGQFRGQKTPSLSSIPEEDHIVPEWQGAESEPVYTSNGSALGSRQNGYVDIISGKRDAFQNLVKRYCPRVFNDFLPKCDVKLDTCELTSDSGCPDDQCDSDSNDLCKEDTCSGDTVTDDDVFEDSACLSGPHVLELSDDDDDDGHDDDSGCTDTGSDDAVSTSSCNLDDQSSSDSCLISEMGNISTAVHITESDHTQLTVDHKTVYKMGSHESTQLGRDLLQTEACADSLEHSETGALSLQCVHSPALNDSVQIFGSVTCEYAHNDNPGELKWLSADPGHEAGQCRAESVNSSKPSLNENIPCETQGASSGEHDSCMPRVECKATKSTEYSKVKDVDSQCSVDPVLDPWCNDIDEAERLNFDKSSSGEDTDDQSGCCSVPDVAHGSSPLSSSSSFIEQGRPKMEMTASAELALKRSHFIR